MVINPKVILELGIVTSPEVPIDGVQVQQVGIDVRVQDIGSGKENAFAGLVPLPGHPREVMVRAGYTTFECCEVIKVPVNMCALLIGRSSLNRQGVFVTSGVYDPGFVGRIGGTMYVQKQDRSITHSLFDFIIKQYDRVAQIVFFKCQSASELYQGQYVSEEVRKQNTDKKSLQKVTVRNGVRRYLWKVRPITQAWQRKEFLNGR